MNRSIYNIRPVSFLLPLLILLLPVTAFAQWQTDTLFRYLDEIEVSATKNVRSLSEVPGRVSVVSQDELRLTPSATVVDVLRNVSGVHTSNTMGFITMRPNVTVRGLSGEEQSRTLVLIDGVPLNNSDTGGVNWNSISLSSIQQVEVYKGPGSSLYGSNAMGGVINIITRKPTEPLTVSAGVSYGTFNTRRSHLDITARAADNLTVQVQGFMNRSDGYNSIPKDNRTEPDHSVPRYVDDYGFNTRVSYSFGKIMELSAGYHLFLNERGEGTEIEAPGMYRKFDKNRFRMDMKGEIRDIRYALHAFYQREDYFRVSERLRGADYTRFNVESDRDDRGITLDLFYNAGTSHSITGGLEVRDGSVDGGDFYQTSDDVVINRGSMRFAALYLQDEIQMRNRKLNLLLGLRYDYATFYDGFFEASDNVRFQNSFLRDYNDPNIPSNSWSTISPRVSLRYSPVTQLSGYLSYSRGFRASILDDLSRTGIFWGRIKIANPDLGPETLDNFEAGLDFRPTWRWSVSPTVFYSLGNDFLYFVGLELQDGTNVWRRENVSSVRLAGLEIDTRYFASDALTFTASYSLYHSEIHSFPERPELEGKQLTYSPRQQAKGSVQWRSPVANLGVNLLYKGSQFSSDDNNAANDGKPEIDGYFTWDVMVSRELIHGFSAAFEVLDVMNNQHLETIDHRSPGRILNLRLTYDF